MNTQENKGHQSERALLFQAWNREIGLIRQDMLAYAVTARHDFIISILHHLWTQVCTGGVEPCW